MSARLTITVDVEGADPWLIDPHEIGETLVCEWLDWRVANTDSAIASDIAFVGAEWDR
jgi:hypothetical protein